VTYTYDGDGRRVEKSNGKLYWYGTSGDPLDETNASGGLVNEYIFFGGKRISRRDSSSNIEYYFADQIGSARVVTNASGTILEDCDYFPYGGSGCSPSSVNNYLFTGKDRDSESGLDEFGARYYSSQYGRFMIPDWASHPKAVPYVDLGNPQSLNLYSYVKNNPLSNVDADGHCDDDGKNCFWQKLGNWFAGRGFITNVQILQNRRDYLTKNGVTDNGEKVNWSNAKADTVNRAYDAVQHNNAVSDALRQVLLTGGTLTAQQVVDYINVTRGSSVYNVQTNVTPEEFGETLEQNGYSKSTKPNGTEVYTKGDKSYSVYSEADSTGGPSADVQINGETISRIRLKQ
jgi:RHS repeat-associated protein